MSDLVVTLTIGQLREMMAQVVNENAQPAVLPKDVLTRTEVAQLIGRSPQTVMKVVEEEGMPVCYLTPKEPRFIRAEVLAWLRARVTQEAV